MSECKKCDDTGMVPSIGLSVEDCACSPAAAEQAAPELPRAWALSVTAPDAKGSMECLWFGADDNGMKRHLFTADQMHAFRAEGIAEDRAARQGTADLPKEPLTDEMLDLPDFWRLVREYGKAGATGVNDAANALLAHIVKWANSAHLAPDAPAQPQPLNQAEPICFAYMPNEKRRIIVASDEVIDGERVLCVAIDDVDPPSRAEPASQPDAGKLAALEAENERLREANRLLHRRAQQIEAPAQSYAQKLEYIERANGKSWMFEFERVIRAHTEIKRIFKELARAYAYPMNAEAFHSVMDSRVDGGEAVAAAVYANCFLSKAGGCESFRVLDEVRRAVDELISARAALGTVEQTTLPPGTGGDAKHSSLPTPTTSSGDKPAEPDEYQYRTRADWHKKWSTWNRCSKESYEDYVRAPLVNEWHYEVRTLFAAPLAAPTDGARDRQDSTGSIRPSAEPAGIEPLPPAEYFKALAITHEAGYASVSMVQRKLQIGWGAAESLIRQMVARGDVTCEMVKYVRGLRLESVEQTRSASEDADAPTTSPVAGVKSSPLGEA